MGNRLVSMLDLSVVDIRPNKICCLSKGEMHCATTWPIYKVNQIASGLIYLIGLIQRRWKKDANGNCHNLSEKGGKTMLKRRSLAGGVNHIPSDRLGLSNQSEGRLLSTRVGQQSVGKSPFVKKTSRARTAVLPL
jgi:hypothetical protein